MHVDCRLNLCSSNQKVSQGGVGRKHKTSFLARLNHPCVGNTQPALSRAYNNVTLVFAESLNTFRLRALLYVGAICPLREELWLNGRPGVKPRMVEIALSDDLSYLGGGGLFGLITCMTGEGRPCPLSTIHWHLPDD
jgi:hypothetical protein